MKHLIPADAAGVADFVTTVVSIWPEFEWRRLVSGEIENLREPQIKRRFGMP